MKGKVYEYLTCEFCYLKPSDDPDAGFSVIEVPEVGPIFLCGSCGAALEYGRAHPEAAPVDLERNVDGDWEVRDGQGS